MADGFLVYMCFEEKSTNKSLRERMRNQLIHLSVFPFTFLGSYDDKELESWYD